jgi:hypothetical protein
LDILCRSVVVVVGALHIVVVVVGRATVVVVVGTDVVVDPATDVEVMGDVVVVVGRATVVVVVGTDVVVVDTHFLGLGLGSGFDVVVTGFLTGLRTTFLW